MAVLFVFIRILIIPTVTSIVFCTIKKRILSYKSFSFLHFFITFITFFFTINIISWLTTSYIYVKDPFFILTKIFGKQRLFIKFTVLWIGLSFCIGMTISACYMLFHIIKQRYNNDKHHNTTALIIHSCVIFGVSLFLILSFIYANNRYPLDQPAIVVETLTLPLSGADPSMFLAAFLQVFLPIILTAIFFIGLYFIIQHSRRKYILNQQNIYSFFAVAALLSYLLLIITIAAIPHQIPLRQYHKTIYEITHPIPAEHSDFYARYYSDPRNIQLTYPSIDRNLILIFLESIENSFTGKGNGGQFDKDLMPELTQLCHENVNFSPNDKIGGGITVSGTYGTMAGIFSKTTGLPLTSQTIQAKYNHRVMANAITLFDILQNRGYEQRFLCGSDKAFASRGDYLETHGVEVRDLGYYKKMKILPKGYHVNWGFEDRKLFEYAKNEADELSDSGKPFMLSLLTVDTHPPTGYTCPLCPNDHNKYGDNRFYDVVHCTSAQTAHFVEWVQKQDWYENTLIVIVGDHPFMNTDLIPNPNMTSRYWLDIFINSAATASTNKNRMFSSFDIFPTILAGLGISIEGNKLGFGTNLFSEEKTLLETINDWEYINSELTRKTIQYEEMQR